MLNLIYNPRDITMPLYYVENSDCIGIAEDELSGRVCNKYIVGNIQTSTPSYLVVSRNGNYVVENSQTRKEVARFPYFIEKALAHAVSLVSGDEVQVIK